MNQYFYCVTEINVSAVSPACGTPARGSPSAGSESSARTSGIRATPAPGPSTSTSISTSAPTSGGASTSRGASAGPPGRSGRVLAEGVLQSQEEIIRGIAGINERLDRLVNVLERLVAKIN